MYRDAALSLGHPEREVAASNLYPVDDPLLRECQKSKHIMCDRSASNARGPWRASHQARAPSPIARSSALLAGRS